MKQYQDMLTHILANGERREDRTGTGTIGIFGYQNRFDLSQGFPILTTKRVPFRSVVVELLWFLRGDTNVQWLQDNGCTIWDEWADEDGDLGPVYGHQWRKWDSSSFFDWDGIDQITELIYNLKHNPFSRRHIVTAWNPADLDTMALPPCHLMFQFYVSNDKKLSCHLYQRSADAFLGVPFNIASYALLTHMIAKVCGFEVGEFVHTFGDLHIYSNHMSQVIELLSRDPRPLPTLEIDTRTCIDDFEIDDFRLVGYNPHAAIKAEVSI